jgi:hypothetical protein
MNILKTKSALQWWSNLTDIKRIEYVEEVLCLKDDAIEIRKYISEEEIQTIYLTKHT